MAQLMTKAQPRRQLTQPKPGPMAVQTLWRGSLSDPLQEIQIRHVKKLHAKPRGIQPLLPRLSISPRRLEIPLQQRIPDALRGRETILVVDKEPLMREVVVENLRQFGYRVLEATDSCQAQHHAHAQRKVHLAVIDLPEPEIKRFELAQWFRAIYPETRLLLLTDWLWGLNLELDSQRRVVVLAKPFTPLELARMVRLVLNEADTAGLARNR
jgi:CheY-like chemotaxis protein